ncbi:glycoside hydrolase family 43 protein [Sphingomonas sp. RHCKR7]|nr:glycoside hydrolase family 43 protein [Sphingomonas folli]
MVASASCLLTATPAAVAANTARFAWVDYAGVANGPAPRGGQFRNPIIAGYYPDPSVVRVGDDVYLVNSTFAWFPGIPVWHSKDLVHWRQIGNAIDRPGQLDFSGRRISEGVFAPAISYHAGRFYIANTYVGCGGNFVITADRPEGPWSAPTWLKNVDGIDPSLFFDDDGSAWLVTNDLPEGREHHAGERAIWLRRFDVKSLQAPGRGRMLTAGSNAQRAPVWIEGPHLFRKDGYYYLMAAEGGTDEKHSEVIFRSDTIAGPYMPAPTSINPILTQRDLSADRPDAVTSTGHAELVRLDRDRWWAVFLGTRPYAAQRYNTGRETFLLPVTWRDGWPVILPHATPVPLVANAPALPASPAAATTGTFSIRDRFQATTLDPAWMMMRTPRTRWWRSGAGLVLEARAERVGDGRQPSFLGRRQQHADATLTTLVTFRPADGEEAGLVAVQNDNYFLSIAVTRERGRTIVRAARRAGLAEPATGRTLARRPVPGGPIALRLHARGARYDLGYRTPGGAWQTLAADVDGTNLSSAVAGGFVGTLMGPYAQRSVGATPRPAQEEPYHLGDTVDGAR